MFFSLGGFAASLSSATAPRRLFYHYTYILIRSTRILFIEYLSAAECGGGAGAGGSDWLGEPKWERKNAANIRIVIFRFRQKLLASPFSLSRCCAENLSFIVTFCCARSCRVEVDDVPSKIKTKLVFLWDGCGVWRPCMCVPLCVDVVFIIRFELDWIT